DRLHLLVAHALARHAARHLVQESLRDLVAMQDAAFAAFLVIDDEVDRDQRPARPLRVGRTGAVADQVARLGILPQRGGDDVSRLLPCGLLLRHAQPSSSYRVRATTSVAL